MERIKTESFKQNQNDLYNVFDQILNYYLYVEQISTHSQIDMIIGAYPFVKSHIFILQAVRHLSDLTISIIHFFKGIHIENVDIIFDPIDKRKQVRYMPFEYFDLPHYAHKIKKCEDYFDLRSDRMNWKWLVNILELRLIEWI